MSQKTKKLLVTPKEAADAEKAAAEKPEEKEQEKERKREKLPGDQVKVKVLVGTLGFENGIFERGSVFQVVRSRAEQFSSGDVQIGEIA